MHENAFLPGTIVRADAMNLKLDGIAQAIQAICSQINQKIPNLPATFTGDTQIPEKTLPNTLLLINSAGAMDLYPKAQFDADVANAATAASQAATSATNAQNSANQALVHEQNAEEHADAALNSATAAAAFADSAEQAKDDTMSALDTRLGTTGNLGNAAQATVVASPTDLTAERLLKVGATKAQLGNDVYGRSNVIGSVSQSAGIPTGAIFEKGSNANGTYTKFTNGTLMCERQISFPGTGVREEQISYSWPAAFANNNYVVSGSANAYGYLIDKFTASGHLGQITNKTTTVNYSIMKNFGGDALNFDVIAIGKWF
jgi:hypothetical protein